MLNRDREDGGRIAERLTRFAELVADESPLYSSICFGVADHPLVARILGEASYQQPPANILLAAVHYQLMANQGEPHRLASHYPSITGSDSTPEGDLVEAFLDVCAAHESELTDIAATRTVQTNEVRRCVGLLPALVTLARGSQPLALLEIGPSAGLNLLLDRYRYDYGVATTGDPDSRLVLSTDLRTGTLPVIDPLPTIVWRRGIDLHPVDVTDPATTRWARALLWPEQLERIERFDRAVEIAIVDPPRIDQGDAVNHLHESVESAPTDAELVVFHTFVLNQFTPEMREALEARISEISRARPVHRLGIDLVERGEDPPVIRYGRYDGGESTHTVLGAMHHHGAWLEWY